MNESIQKQVEQFASSALSGRAISHVDIVDNLREYHALLRSVVEECCKQTRLDYDDEAIRHHFAWLLEEKP